MDAGTPLIRVGQPQGEGTTNIAEYTALLEALRHALRMGLWTVNIKTDSNLLVKQVTGQWKTTDRTLGRLCREAQLLMGAFQPRARIEHVYREEQTDVDELSRSLHDEGPQLPPPPPGRALHSWQAAAINIWWHNDIIRSAAILGRVFGIREQQVDQIVRGAAYLDATLCGMPTYAPLTPTPFRCPQCGYSVGKFVLHLQEPCPRCGEPLIPAPCPLGTP